MSQDPTTDPTPAPERRDLVHEFAGYLKACYGDRPLSPVQHKEIRQAFMAGALVTLQRVAQLASLSEDDATEALANLFDEVEHENTPRQP